jgi:hypothetical protein
MALATVITAFLVGGREAASQTHPEGARAEQLAARVVELERRVRKLEQRLAPLEHLRLERRADGSYAVTANGVPLVMAADGTLTPAVSGTAGAPGSTLPLARQEDPCDPPYRVLENGIRRFKIECLSAAADECDPPYSLDLAGLRHFKPQCF